MSSIILVNSLARSSSEFVGRLSAVLACARAYARGSLPKVAKNTVTYVVSDFTLLAANSAIGSLST